MTPADDRAPDDGDQAPDAGSRKPDEDARSSEEEHRTPERKDETMTQTADSTRPTEVLDEPSAPGSRDADGFPVGAMSLPTTPRPPIRWGGVVWGLILGASAAWTLWVVSTPERVAAAERWVSALTPASAWVLAAALLGVIIAVSALLAAIRSTQRRRERRLF